MHQITLVCTFLPPPAALNRVLHSFKMDSRDAIHNTSSDNDITDNVFASLFNSHKEAENKVVETAAYYQAYKEEVNEAIEDIFKVTINIEKETCIYLEALHRLYPQGLMEPKMIQPALFMRNLVKLKPTNMAIVQEDDLDPYIYLFKCYNRLTKRLKAGDILSKNYLKSIKKELFNTFLKSPMTFDLEDNLYASDTHEKVWKIIKSEEYRQMLEFLDEIIATFNQKLFKAKNGNPEKILKKLFERMIKELYEIRVSQIYQHENIFEALTWMACKPNLGKVDMSTIVYGKLSK